MSSYSIAGKIFLLGEYAVLDRRPALVYALPPRFSIGSTPMASTGAATVFHPDSPAGRLQSYARARGEWTGEGALVFRDAWDGAGGFGGSTAEFALVYRAIADRAGWDLAWPAVWRLYGELTGARDGGFPPSGADLVAQWEGGLAWVDLGAGTASPVTPRGAASAVWILSATAQAGRKVATHEHLQRLREVDLRALADRLTTQTRAGLDGFVRGDAPGLGMAFDRYGDELRACGLELPATTADRAALRALPGVLGVKGTGALQADALALVLEEPEIDKGARDGANARKVRQVAESRGLRVVAQGLVAEPGIS